MGNNVSGEHVNAYNYDYKTCGVDTIQVGDDLQREPLEQGAKAPDFTLYATPNQTLSLSDFHDQPVILIFYPADWSPVCGDQLALYNEIRSEFDRFDAQPLGISVDGVWCHTAFADARNLKIPMLSDFEPKGAVSRAYGVYRDEDGTSERALFVIDRDGIIQWSYVSPVGINPGADGILNALEELTTSTPNETSSHE